jgi:outer membrane protein assembly factor BamB
MERSIAAAAGLSALLALHGCANSEPVASTASSDTDGYCGEMQVSYTPAEQPVSSALAGIAGIFVRRQAVPLLTAYRPQGIAARSLAEATHPVLTPNDRFYTLHGGVRSSDEVDVAYPPVFEHVWTAEPRLFLPEGPTFGDGAVYAASAYFFPGSELDYALLSLDMQTGARRWKVVPGQTGQGGATLVLRDPATQGNVIYGGGARAVFALDEAGQVRWCRNTGLDVNVDPFATREVVHMFGINYHVRTDSVVAVYASGDLIAFDRASGRVVARMRMPGAPAAPGTFEVPQPFIDGAERAFRASFVPPGYPLPAGYSFVQTLITAILGGGIRVANYYAADPDSDLLWIASTLGDEADGTQDGQAEFGALYGIRLRRGATPENSFDVHCTIPFEGGSAATPDVYPGGDRIYTSDAFGKVLAFDKDCRQMWATDLKQQVIGSLAVSSTDHAIYASTGEGIFKLEDRGDSGPIVWTSKSEQSFTGGDALLPLLGAVSDAFESAGLPLPASVRANNLEIAGIGENGVMVQYGLGIQASADDSLAFLPAVVSMTLLDKQTGAVLNAAPAQEESVAVISTGQDGALYIGNSPIRRGFLRGILEPGPGGVVPSPIDPVVSLLVPPLIGGVSKYAPKNGYRYFVRDATCLAQRRLEAWQQYSASAATAFSLSLERAVVTNLIRQSADNLALAFAAGEIPDHGEMSLALDEAEAGVEAENLSLAIASLSAICANTSE